jgi:hypothetical protein
MTREPLRTRLLILVSALIAVLIVAGYVLADRQPSRSPWIFVMLGAGLVVTITVAGIAFVNSIRALSGAQRLHTFQVGAHGFDLPQLNSTGLTAAFQLLIFGNMAGMLGVSAFHRDDDVLLQLPIIFLLFVFAVCVAVVCVIGWNGPVYRLTPSGIVWRAPLARQEIPWEALAPGGPVRPQSGTWMTGRLHLATVRPDLVRQRGIRSWIGNPQYPALPIQTRVHPWFLADAIRWYAEHPEHRAGIGTQAELDRLIATLAPGLEAARPYVIRLPRPPSVTAAAWLTWAGVAWGLLWAGANLFVALAFHDQIVAAERAADRAEELATGEPAGEAMIGGSAQTTGFAIAGLVLAALAGVGAVLLTRALRKGSDAARIGLIVLCGAIVLWSFCGSWATTPMPLLETEDPLGGLTFLAFAGNQGLSVLLSIAVFVLLVLPVSNRYFRPARSVQ